LTETATDVTIVGRACFRNAPRMVINNRANVAP
jgi:hypothetical protein